MNVGRFKLHILCLVKWIAAVAANKVFRNGRRKLTANKLPSHQPIVKPTKPAPASVGCHHQRPHSGNTVWLNPGYLSLFKSPSGPELPYDLLIDLLVEFVPGETKSPATMRIQTIFQRLQLPSFGSPVDHRGDRRDRSGQVL